MVIVFICKRIPNIPELLFWISKKVTWWFDIGPKQQSLLWTCPNSHAYLFAFYCWRLFTFALFCILQVAIKFVSITILLFQFSSK